MIEKFLIKLTFMKNSERVGNSRFGEKVYIEIKLVLSDLYLVQSNNL